MRTGARDWGGQTGIPWKTAEIYEKTIDLGEPKGVSIVSLGRVNAADIWVTHMSQYGQSHYVFKSTNISFQNSSITL